MRSVVAITKALADESRLRVLWALKDGELCACHIVAILALAPSTVSKHMSILRTARLVDGRKAGRWMYYRLAGADSPREAVSAVAWVHAVLPKAKQIQADSIALKGILQLDPEPLCRDSHAPAGKRRNTAAPGKGKGPQLC